MLYIRIRELRIFANSTFPEVVNQGQTMENYRKFHRQKARHHANASRRFDWQAVMPADVLLRHQYNGFTKSFVANTYRTYTILLQYKYFNFQGVIVLKFVQTSSSVRLFDGLMRQ